MSEYFRVLRRLDRERGAAATARAAASPMPGGERVRQLVSVASPAAARGADEPLLRAPAPERSGQFAALYDNLRAAASGRPMRTLVFAGAAAPVGVDRIVAGLAAHVRHAGQRVLLARLAEADGQRRLIAVSQPGEGDWSVAPPLALDLGSHIAAGSVAAWLDRHADGADLVCLAAGPLGAVDAAFLASACDGLVIVVQSERTPRVVLRDAVERARAVGCVPLGVVVVGSRDPLPAWLRRLLPAPPTPFPVRLA